MQEDQPIKATAEDALSSKNYATQLGYVHDPFISLFARDTVKRPPLINRGYWARVHRVKMTVDEFLRIDDDNKQIISIGAGFDTAYWLLRTEKPEARFQYTEIDFEDVCNHKSQIIASNPQLFSMISSPITPNQEILARDYKLLHADLRNSRFLMEKLALHTNTSAPTLILAECVLAYMEAQHSDSLIEDFSTLYPNSAFLNYDMIQPHDPFGRTMIQNLRARHVELKGIVSYPTVASHLDRFRRFYERVDGYNMLMIYNRHTDRHERERVEKLEWMDEFEEWNMLMEHYCMIIGCKGSVNLAF
mmetsp:Transcript_9283/g.9285  ORF Transcript_9283/g.9285 Transcript_9283/m.9285 type:complete len:304 (-) Transcript_9283:31-942(-)